MTVGHAPGLSVFKIPGSSPRSELRLLLIFS
ncbi:hypothetical protein DWB77_00448 [Streptomyces hundungensis]|uniref:Uncharacterized protein n=1 Tax=Streptomyces hundungensis TaxID=1077946 RepID=A0A387H6Y5_9ACTN|nr:hypothetical protein DWB77_00448 [Streptomyces hundungensis]